MTKSFSHTPYHRVYSVIAGGLGCASLLSGVSNVAIAKQAATVMATDPAVGTQDIAQSSATVASVDRSPIETALVLPPEYLPPETLIGAAEGSVVAKPSTDAIALDPGSAVNLISVDIDTAAAGAPSVDVSAVELSAKEHPTTPSVVPPTGYPSSAESLTPLANPPAAEISTAAPVPNPSTTDEPVDYGTRYIDPTDYSLGATEPEAGPDVVLSERSTGCKAVLRQGEAIPSSLCDTTTATSTPGQLPSTEGRTGNSTPPPNVNAVRVGAVTIDGRGIHLRRSVRDYYNRTNRPKALQSNNDRALMFPLSVPARISSPFGWRIHPIFGNHRLHTGTDMAAPEGTPIVAAFSGRVALSDILGGYGVTVVLQHDERSAQTLYGHMSEVFVKSGEWVEQGTVIGRVGSTGNSTGPHLHFEYRQRTAEGWVAVNAGQLLQQALGHVNDGFQLAVVAAGSSLEMTELSIPKLLRVGKDATKDSTIPAAVASENQFQVIPTISVANVANLEAPTP